jgi:hypothetical protein
VAEEAKEEGLVVADAASPDSGDEVHYLDGVLAAVGQLPAFQVGPQPLGRVEVGGVGGQPLGSSCPSGRPR